MKNRISADGVNCLAIVDSGNGELARAASNGISKWFTQRGKRVLILGGSNGKLTGQLERGAVPDGHVIDDSLIASFADAFDLILFVFGNGVLDFKFDGTFMLPAMIVASLENLNIRCLKNLVEGLLSEKFRPRPAAFVLDEGDRLAESKLSRRIHIPSWGGMDDPGHVSQRIIERSFRFVVGGDEKKTGNGGGQLTNVDEVVVDVLNTLKSDGKLKGDGRAAHALALQDDIRVAARRNLGIGKDGPVNGGDVECLVQKVVDDTLGFGPLEEILRDGDVTEIMVNGAGDIHIEKNGILEKTSHRFRDDNHLLAVIERMVAGSNRRIDESSPMVDARLSDGSRLNAVIPPLAVDGPTLTIRRFLHKIRSMDDIVAGGMLSTEAAEFLMNCVRMRASIVISGGTGSGKTTLLGIISSAIPPSERIITIEDAAELCLAAPHVVRLESRPPNIEGAGKVTIRDLVRNALRMRPDRIVVGECRGPEALDMLQAMNTGHEGSLTSVHANSPRDALSRIETMILMADIELPLHAVREQIARAVDIIVHVARTDGGARRVVELAEVTGMEGQTICMQTIASFNRQRGVLEFTGLKPRFIE